MARSRNIKPAFFDNDLLADNDPLGRLLFIGLWTISDYKGDLEYRPNRLKAQLLPYDNCDIKELITNLDKSRFITIYSLQGCDYIHINNFCKHQNPHPNEKRKGSEVPEYKKEYTQVIDNKGLVTKHDKTRQVSEHSITDRADSLILYPDSCSLIPDSGNLIPSKTIVELKPDVSHEIFKHWQKTFNHPRSAFDKKRKALIKKWLALYSFDDLIKAIEGCSRTPHNMGDNREGRIYDSIELILRDAKHIDDYMRNYDSPPTGKVKTMDQFKRETSARAQRMMESMGMSDE